MVSTVVLCCLCAPCASGLGQVIVSGTTIPTESPESFYLIVESFSEKTSGNSSNFCLSETLLISFFKVWVISPFTEHEIKSPRHTKRQMEMINKSQYLCCGLCNSILLSASYLIISWLLSFKTWDQGDLWVHLAGPFCLFLRTAVLKVKKVLSITVLFQKAERMRSLWAKCLLWPRPFVYINLFWDRFSSCILG